MPQLNDFIFTFESTQKSYCDFQDCKNLGGRNVCVMTDGKLKDMQPVHTTLQSLDDNKVKYKLFDRCRVEPTNER